MDDTKSLLQSRTVWGAAVAMVGVLAPPLLDLAGVHDAEQQRQVIDLLARGLALAGAAAALWGRIRATRRIVVGKSGAL